MIDLWNVLCGARISPLGLSPDDGELLLARLKSVFGDGDAGAQAAARFLQEHDDDLGGVPVAMMHGGNDLGTVRVLDHLKARGSP